MGKKLTSEQQDLVLRYQHLPRWVYNHLANHVPDLVSTVKTPDDVVSEGNVALCLAARAFNPCREPPVKFMTYATIIIYRRMVAYISTNGPIKIPLYMMKLIGRIQTGKITEDDLTEREIVKIEQAEEVMDVKFDKFGIEGSYDGSSVYAQVDNEDLCERCMDVMGTLLKSEREALMMHLEDKTRVHIARQLGIRKMEVKPLVDRAIAKIREQVSI